MKSYIAPGGITEVHDHGIEAVAFIEEVDELLETQGHARVRIGPNFRRVT